MVCVGTLLQVLLPSCGVDLVASLVAPYDVDASDSDFGTYHLGGRLRQYCWNTPNVEWQSWRSALSKLALTIWPLSEAHVHGLRQVMMRLEYLNLKEAPAEQCSIGAAAMKIADVAVSPPEEAAALVISGKLDSSLMLILSVPFIGIMHLGWPIFQLLHILNGWIQPHVGKEPDSAHEFIAAESLEEGIMGLVDVPVSETPLAAVNAALTLFTLFDGPQQTERALSIYPAALALLDRAQRQLQAHVGGLVDFLRHKDSQVLAPLSQLAVLLAGTEESAQSTWRASYPATPDFLMSLTLGGVNMSVIVDRYDTIQPSRRKNKVLYEEVHFDGVNEYVSKVTQVAAPNALATKRMLAFLGDPTPSATFARYFLSNCRSEFYGAEPTIESFISTVAESARRLARCWPEYDCAPLPDLVLVDIGAAPFDGNSFVVDFLNAFGCDDSVKIFAFEPLAKNLDDLSRSLEDVSGRECVMLKKAAATNFSGSVTMYGHGRTASLLYREAQRYDLKVVPPEDVTAIALDDWAEVEKVRHVDFLKIDVEGAEWLVLQGAWQLLVEKRITFVVIEYGHFWSRQLWAASNEGKSIEGEVPWPSLRGVTERLDEIGYDAYFIGTRAILPINGGCWHEVYEVCRHPHSSLYRGTHGWCWFDVLFCDRSQDLCATIRRSFVPWHLVRDKNNSQCTM